MPAESASAGTRGARDCPLAPNPLPFPMSPAPRFLACLAALMPVLLQASYYDLTRNTKEAQEVVTYDVRYPYWTKSIYAATYPGHSRSKEGWIAPYYGGIVSDKDGPTQLIQFASWQMGGKGAPGTGIDFVHAGRHMSWERSTWEGSSGGIKGKWPNDEFKPGQWYRFVHRVWTPAASTPHLGYAGIWMKSLETGEWHHLATFKFPAELTGFNNMGGFNEFITDGASETNAVEFRNSYAKRSGKWVSEAEFSAINHKEDTIRLIPSEDRRSITLETTRTPKDPATKRHTVIPTVRQKATLAQPETPDFFDAPKLVSPSAEGFGRRLLVSWKHDPKAAPQLGYSVELLDGDKVVASATENDPLARQAVLEVPGRIDGIPSVRIRLTDIFGGATAPASIPVTLAKPLPARNLASSAAPGLSYRYYESAKPDDWRTLPDFDKLTPARQGVVATPELSPRLKRTGYAFDFSGYLRVPEDGLYTFNLVAACGAKLIIDDTTVIDADGYHSISNTAGAVALRAGYHKIRLPYYQGARQFLQADDFLQLTWSGPRFENAPVGVDALRRETSSGEPVANLTARPAGAGGINLELSTKVSRGKSKVERVEYYATNAEFDYFSAQGARSLEYLLAENTDPAAPTPAVLWGGKNRSLRARLVYSGNRTVDSAPVVLPDAPPPPSGKDALKLSALEHHLYPPAFSEDKGVITLAGESMNLLTRPVTGDCTIVARLVDITPDKAQADGTTPQDASNWYSGIILRNNVNERPGEPLGGADIPFSAVMGTSNRQTRHCDSTMINGAGNQPSGNVGGDHRWFKIERKGVEFTTSISKDGKEWKVIKTVSLPKATETMEAGFVHYAIPCATPRVHWAKFDNFSITPAK